MARPLMKIVGTFCGRSLDTYFDCGGGRDELMWCRDLSRHAAGEFSMAVVQANSLVEDASQIESGTHGTFVGVYDGHGGPEAARYVADNLFQWIGRFIDEEEGMSADVLHKALLATEDGFLSIVKKNWSNMPLLATVGSCCLTGFICGGMLYTANIGDSRAVLGRFNLHERGVVAVQLTPEHNACHESVRQELRLLHPADPKIVVLKNRAWRVKGIIQVSRSIGDAYLKKAEFNKEPLIGKFRLSESFSKPILLAEPSVVTHKICPQDQFVIFASDGLWEHISNQEAVDMVQNSPRNGIARRLIEAALQVAARKREIRYSDLKKIDRGIRRHFHDDITVIVLFLDHSLASKSSYTGPVLSLRAGK
ncbi:probable protein phosphatase 2C 28 [Dendrobium catenatum]|uniref:protein-serine/threonine phosphatase n=1 Tax=Dendrobium catenatum TaxID=906689 RepID=A0A2I0VVL1_9ASPA|nr:probable protein phosphatase 2C 28 [Dendrobium catenatum]PKU67444.1 putative protein phosphatase 2C 28 [Dendrobium catenatum]